MKSGRLIVTGAVGLAIAAAAYAGGHSPVEQRQAAMKAVGGEMRPLGAMAKGDIEFDILVAMASFQTMRDAAAVAQPLFMAPSENGEETRAMPEIWAADSDFDDRMAQLIASLDAALAAEPSDVNSYRPLFGAVAGTCKGCHEKYRAPEE